jgi:hypothetical protein
VSTQGLWRESEAFLRRQVATVFENSAASVYVETSAARSRAGEAINLSGCFGNRL